MIDLLYMNFINVNKLQILEKTSEPENESTLFGFLIQNKFTELKTLNLFGIHRLSVENLNRIKLSCPQLNTLILSHCRCNGEHGVLQDRSCNPQVRNPGNCGKKTNLFDIFCG